MIASIRCPLPLRACLWAGVASLVLVACSSKLPPYVPAAPATPAPPPTAKPTLPPPVVAPPAPTLVSHATTPRDYRRDGAKHLYSLNTGRIFPGKLPPQLYAIGVLDLDINANGAVTALRWRRAPSHAPEVVKEIERSVRLAEPFPAPIKLRKVTYTDTWLWDVSGRFQLDTLTEGQL